MTRYTVFQLCEEDVAEARRMSVEHAFALVCKRAGFTPNFWQKDGETTVDFTDNTKLDRELPCVTLRHEVPGQAMRELMVKALETGVWGWFAMPDLKWDDHCDRMKKDFVRSRGWDPKEPMRDGERLKLMKMGARS